MQNFARQWVDPVFQFTWILLLVVTHVSLVFGLICGVISSSWQVGVSVASAIFLFSYCLAILVWYSGKRCGAFFFFSSLNLTLWFLFHSIQHATLPVHRYDWKWATLAHLYFTKKVDSLRLVLQIMFCHPPGVHSDDVLAAHPIRLVD